MKNSYIQLDLKASNRRTVYDTLVKAKMISRAELSRALGISGATILKIIDYFVDRGICLYVDASEDYRSVGRKPAMLRFNPNFAHIVSVFVEGEYISVAVVNMGGEICEMQEYRILDVWGFLFSKLNAVIRSLLDSVEHNHLVGIGVALPAVINQDSNEIVEAPLLGNTEASSLNRLVAMLEEGFAVPVCVQNDVNACAYGEYRNVYANLTRNLLYISVGTGVGCGLILHSEIVLGENNSAGEIGYMIFDEGLDQREFAGGWLENRVNLSAVTKLLDSPQCKSLPPERRPEPVIDRISRQLSLCIVNNTTLVDVNTVVLGGVVVENYGEPLVQAVRQRVAALHYQKRSITLCKTYKPGVVGLSYLASASMLERLMEE